MICSGHGHLCLTKSLSKSCFRRPPLLFRTTPLLKPCSQQTNSTKLTCTNLTQVTRRVIGHARQRHEVDWLQCSRTGVRALQFSSVRLAVNTALDCRQIGSGESNSDICLAADGNLLVS